MDLGFLGRIEEFVAELYPYRWPITLGAIALTAAIVAVAVRRGWHRLGWGYVGRHPLMSAVAALAVLAIALPAGDYLLSPLWERSHLDEASPLAAAQVPVAPATGTPAATATPSSSDGASPDSGPPDSQPAATQTAFEPRVIARGEFMGADDFHFGRGDALLIETEPGRYVLRFENFSVRNGPDLFVYLSPNPDGYGDDAINLGGLKATDGAFNYEVPEGVDISSFTSAIVWCDEFDVLFATATFVDAT